MKPAVILSMVLTALQFAVADDFKTINGKECKNVTGGRATAITSGTFSLSSNHANSVADRIHLGGQGWIIAPDGEVLGLTSHERPFITMELDLNAAEQAKHTYPRYAL
jgi:predicted amidohydrolase